MKLKIFCVFLNRQIPLIKQLINQVIKLYHHKIVFKKNTLHTTLNTS